MSVFLTGGGGFLGSAVASRLPGAVAPTSAELDLTRGEDVADAVRDWAPRTVVHLAARVGGIVANISEQADFLIDNLRIDANVLAALRAKPPAHLITMLSTCMYPDRLAADRYPMSEDMIEDGPPPPTNASYAAAKRALWHGTKALHSQYGVPYTALVPSNLYGPGDHFGESESHFLAAAIDRVERARMDGADSVSFFGRGIALRQYLYVEDLADLVARLVEEGPLNETVNVAPSSTHTIRELALLVSEASGFGGDVRFTGEGADGQLRKDVSSARLRELVSDWAEIETPLEHGLRRTIDWYRDHVATR